MNIKCTAYNGPADKTWTETRILAVTKWWVEQLGLDRSEYKIKYLVDTTGEAFKECGADWEACVQFSHAYLYATVQFNLPMWKENTDEQGQEDILHELAHILLHDFPAPNTDTEGNERNTSDAEERCCQRVARAILKAKGLCPL